MADSLFVEMYAALHNSRYAAGKQFRPGQRMPKGYVFHNTSQDAAASIAAQGMEGGSFADRPGDFGGDAWLAVHQDDLPPAQSHQYGDLVAYEPQWQTDEQDQEGFPVYRRIHPSKIHLVDSKGRFLRSLAEPERYTEPHDTLAADDTPAPAPQLTPTAMPGLKIREPKPDRGWLLARGHTSDPAVLERLRGRATKRGYDLDVQTIHTAEGQPIHHLRVYGRKGQPLATDRAGKPEFFECGGEPQKYAAEPSPYAGLQSPEELVAHLRQEHADHLQLLNISEPHGRSVHLDQIKIRPESRGQGIGSKVLQAIQQYATARGLPVTLEARPEPRKKAALEAFYRAHGFRDPGRTRDYSLARHTHIWRPANQEATDQQEPEHYAAHDTDEFRRWFGESKVRHPETGEPLVVYHGTTRAIEAFAQDHPHRRTDATNRISELGHFFTPRADVAGMYSDRPFNPEAARQWEEHRHTTSNIVPAFLSLRNPRVYGSIGEFYGEAQQKGAGLRDELMKLGHDGIWAKGKYGDDELVAFHPHQIKSATGNRGTFDPQDPRITYRQDGTPERFATRHWEDLANEIAASSENNPLVPEHASIRQGGKHWGSRWMDSDNFHQMEVPLSAIDWNPGYMESDEFRSHPPARTSGPIVIDNNWREVGHTDEQGTPRLIVLDGQHRLRDARARGDQTIQAWVGEKAMQHLAPEQYAARPLRSSPGQLGLPFQDEHETPLPRPPEPAPVPVDVQRPTPRAGGGPGGEKAATAAGPVPHYSETPAFKSWFGDSKLRDQKTGRPLTLYHGTNSEVAEFRPFAHFGTAKAANDRYKHLRSFSEDVVGRDAGAFSIHPVHVRMENPLRMPDLASLDANTHQSYDEAMREFKRKYRTKKDRQRAEDNGEMPRVASWEDESDLSEYLYRQGIIEPEEFWEVQYSPQKAMELLKQKGYDGIIYNNAVEDPGNDSYIVFDPEQVKSATGNRGTWSRSDKRTTYTMPEAKAELYAAFWGAAFDVERYAKHKPQAGQKSLWAEEDHPREPKGTKGGHGGEFTEKRDNGPTHEMATSPGHHEPKGSSQGAADLPGGEESRAVGQEGKPGPAGLTAQEAIAKAMEGSTRKTMSYEQACHATWLYNGTKPQDWSAVAVKEVRAVDDGKGGQVEMPIFDMPSGYDHAPVIFHGDSQNPCCELCSHQIKFVYWIKNDEAKQMMAVGSECVTGFGEGKSGKQLERETKATMNRDLLRQAWTAYDKLVEAFGYPVAKDVPQNEIANPDAIYWRLRDRSDLPRVNQLSPEDRQRADKMREAAQPIWKTFQDLRARLFTKQGVPVAADQRTHHHSYYHSAPGGRGGWRYAPHRHDPQPDGNVTRWVKKHGDDIRRLLDDVDLIFGQDQTAKYAMAFADAFVDRYAKLKPQRGQRSLFAEDDHPRGQPENAGEFRKKDAPAPVEKGSDAPSQKTPTGPVGKSSDAPTARDIQAKSHTVHDVVSGRVPVGVHSSKADEQVARDAGLYTTRVGKLLVYAESQDAAAPVVQYLEAGGQYGTPEFSRLLHYSPDEITEYQRFLESQGRHDLLSPPPAGTTGSRPGGSNALTGREADHIGDANKMVESRPNPDIAGQDPDTPKSQNVGKSAQVPTNPDIGGQKQPWEMTADEWTQAAKADVDEPLYHLDHFRKEELDESIERRAIKLLKGKRPAPGNARDEIERLQARHYANQEPFRNAIHRAFIEHALRTGKPVPPEVLADYPDLQPQHYQAEQPPKRQMSRDEYLVATRGPAARGAVFAFKMRDGTVHHSDTALSHLDLLHQHPVPYDDIESEGWIIGGQYHEGDPSSAAPKPLDPPVARHRLTADQFAQMCVERYAEQQRRLFDDHGGAPRREFDERKHARETGTSGKFARKYPRVLSREIQPALPGVEMPPEQRVVTRKRPVAQLPTGPAPQPTAYPVGHEFHTDPLVSNGGADHRVPVRIHKMDDTHAHIGYGDSPELGYKSDGHTFARIPREAVEQFVNDLQGRVAVPPDHHDPRIRMIASGQAKFLGKGDDGMAFDTGDHVVKVSTVVPFHWTNYHGTYTPEQAARTLRDQVALNNEMLDAGVPGLLRQGFFFHGGKGFAPMQKLQIPDQFEQQHIDQLRETLDAMHQRDYVLRDEVQAGLGPDGRAYMFDTGKAKKLEPGYRWAKDDKNSDRDHLKRLAERHGLQNPWAKDDANERYNDFDTRMIRHAQAIRDRTLDPALAARLMERGQKLFAELQAQDPEQAAAWEFPHRSNIDDLASIVGTPDRHHMFASLWDSLLVDRYARQPKSSPGQMSLFHETVDAAPDPMDIIHQHEDKIRHHQDREHGAIFSRAGELLQELQGHSNGVVIEPHIQPKLAGAIFTHNHPLGWGFMEGMPQRGGNALSGPDWAVATAGGLAEMRAVSPGWRHSLRIPDGWHDHAYERMSAELTPGQQDEVFEHAKAGMRPNELLWHHYVKPRWQKHDQDVKREFWNHIYDAPSDAEMKARSHWAEANHAHEVSSRLAAELGLQYTREEYQPWKPRTATPSSQSGSNQTPTSQSTAQPAFPAETSVASRTSRPAAAGRSRRGSRSKSGSAETTTGNPSLETTGYSSSHDTSLAADLYSAFWGELDRYAHQPSLFDKSLTVETRPDQPGIAIQSSPQGPGSATADKRPIPDISLREAVPPPSMAGLNPRQQARLQELLARSFRRTPAEQQEFQDLRRRVEDTEDQSRQEPARYTSTDTPEFQEWFGKSHVVGPEGKPLVVYHGTNHPKDFDVFQSHKPDRVLRLDGQEVPIANSWDMGDDSAGMPEGIHFGAVSDAKQMGAEKAYQFRLAEAQRAKPDGNFHTDTKRHLSDLQRMAGKKLETTLEDRPTKDGFYFTPSLDYSFIRNAGNFDNGRVIPVYLSLQNPKYLNASEIEGAGADFNVEKLKREGYDGAVFVNDRKDWTKDGWDGSPQIVAFYPHQVKSAIANRGTWSKADERITHQQPGRPERYRDPATPEQSPATGTLHHTQTPEFKRFFGDWEAEPHNASKVVHPEGHPRETHEIEGTGSQVNGPSGKPMAVYHGTATGGFQAFDPKRASPTGLFGPGFYFTEDPEVAKTYTAKDMEYKLDRPITRRDMDRVRRFLQSKAAIRDANSDIGIRSAYQGVAMNLQAAYDDNDPKPLENVLRNTEAGERFRKMLGVQRVATGSPEVKTVYLNIRKPFMADQSFSLSQIAREFGPEIANSVDRSMGYRMKQQGDERHLDGESLFEALRQHATNTQPMKVNAVEYANQKIRDAGYDGISHIGGSRMGGGHSHRVWIAFRPHQIKSVQNRGTWDPEDERMDYEQRDEPVAAQYRQAFADAFVTQYREAADQLIFCDLLDLQATIDRYKAKESKGQQHLFETGEHDVSDEPRDAGGRWTKGADAGRKAETPREPDAGRLPANPEGVGDRGETPIPDPAEYLRGLFADRAHREMMSRALDRPRDELQRLRDERNRRRAANQSMLPPPRATLGPNEELVAKAKAGDRQAMSDLWERNKGLVGNALKRWHLHGADLEDAMGDVALNVFLGDHGAVAKFDPALGFRWTTYFTKAVERYMVRRHQRQHGTKDKPLPKMLTSGSDREARHNDPEATAEPDQLESDERAQAMEEALRKVKPKYQKIVRWIYGIGGEQLSEVEIAARTGMKKQQVSWIKHRALEILRDQLADRELYRQQLRDAFVDRYSRQHWNTPEFQEWFGDSKVRHPETGEPLVVYHGTPTPGFASFSKRRRGSRTGSPDARHSFSFTTVPSDAADYARGTTGDATPATMPVYLRITNPLHIEQAATPEIIRQAKDAGHDGLILTWADGNRELTVFEPHQIKSATGNRGTYSKDDPRINYRQSFADAFVERYGIADAVLRWASPKPPEPSEAVKQRAQALGQQLRQPQPPAPRQPYVDEFDLKYPKMPAMRQARETLDALHNTADLQKRADPVAFKLADQETRARRDSEAWQNAYERHIGNVRQQIHGELKAKVPDLLKAAREEHAHHQRMSQQVMGLGRSIEQQMQDLDKEDPGHQYLKKRLAEMKPILRGHRQLIDSTIQDLETRGAPDAIPEPEQWVNPRVQRQRERQDIQDHRRRVRELERAGQQVTGPTGDRIADERDPGFRQAIRDRHLELQRNRPAPTPKPTPAAKPSRGTTAPQAPTDSAGWLDHATEMVHRATTETQLDARAKSIALTNWRREMPSLTPKGNPAFGRYYAAAKKQAHGEYQAAARQALDQAAQWHQQAGQPAPAQLQALEARLAGKQAPKGPTGFEDVQPTVSRVDKAGNELTAAQMGARKAAETKRKNEQERKAKEHQTRNPEVPRPSDIPAHLDELPEGIGQSPHLDATERKLMGRLYGLGNQLQQSFTDMVNELVRTKAGQGQDWQPPEDQQRQMAHQVAERVRDAIGRHKTAVAAAQYGMSPKEYDQIAADALAEKIDQARATNNLIDSLHSAKMQAELDSGKDHSVMLKGFNALAEPALRDAGIAGVTDSNAMQKAQEILERGKVPVPGPHTDEWHQAVQDQLGPPDEPIDITGDEWDRNQDAGPGPDANDDEPVPFTARHHLRRELYHALAGLVRQPAA